MFAPNVTLNIRQENLIGSRLTRSTCMFRLNVDLACVDYTNDRSLLDFRALGGDIEFDATNSILILRINHSRMDAFGGLYVISNFLDKTKIISLPRTNSGHSSQIYDGFLVHHYWQRALQAPTLTSGLTFTQQFASNLLAADQTLGSVDICVSADDLSKMSAKDIGGNSLGIVKIQRFRLAALAAAPRSQWTEYLKKRALHSQKAPSVPSGFEPSRVLVSSIGDLDKLPWTSKCLNTSNFMMFPTPAEGCVNAVMWSSQGIQALTVGYSAQDSTTVSATCDAVLTAWRKLFQ